MRACGGRARVPGRVDPLETTLWSIETLPGEVVVVEEMNDPLLDDPGPSPSPDPGPSPSPDPERIEPRLKTGRRKAIPSSLMSWSYVNAVDE